MIKCLVIDDEPLAIALLTDYIKKTASLAFVNAYSDPIKALQEINDLDVDLIFLDVQMPELNGIQLLKIFNHKFDVILTTAYQQYAIDGFDHNVIDYLLKPISYDRFYKAIEKVVELKQNTNESKAEINPVKDFIFVKSEYRIHKLDLNDIFYFEGLGDYVAIHLADSKLLTLEKMKYFDQVLPEENFMRVHKSFIIAFSKIEYIERNRILIKGERIPISDTYKKTFFDKIKS